ncbi:MAG: 50S ribosomal protein L25 [Candidatus Doudnabacteria bacterium]|nr:50S ribosomal protein L25 [Candidatus Doudnabacteria bacterium]
MKIKLDALRKVGQIPAVLYGNKIQNQNLILNSVEFEKVFRKAGESTLVNLTLEDGKVHPVLIQDVQYHNLKNTPIHVDFYQVSMSDKLKANVALEFTGESSAVKTLGGVLNKQINEVQVECLPADLPHNILVDISSLKTFEDAVYVKDLKVDAKVKILAPADEVVAKVQPPRDMEKELSAQSTEDVAAVLAATDAEKAKAAAAKEEAKSEEAK